jgi:hypothetical protein
MAKRSNRERRPAASHGGALEASNDTEEAINQAGAEEQSEVATVEGARVTRELPAVEFASVEFASEERAPEAEPAPEEAELSEDAESPEAQPFSVSELNLDNPEEFDEDEGATREVSAVLPPQAPLERADPDATVMRATPPPPTPQAMLVDETPDAGPTQATPPSRPRFNTLAGAFNRSRPTPTPAAPPVEQGPMEQGLMEQAPTVADLVDDALGIVDEVDPEAEWSVADQPTVYLTPEQLRALRPASFLDTSEQASWPPRPQAATPSSAPRAQAPTQPRSAPQPPATPDERDPRDWRSGLPPRPQPPFPLEGVGRLLTQSERLAAPDGRTVHPSVSSGAMPDYRMERFQELRRHRVAHEQGEAATDDVTPVADAVRQWWNDLRPNVGSALRFQREARASGTHPLPAYAPPPTASRLGDAFGRLAASARGVAGPALKRIHDQVEQAAQGIIQRFEGDSARQQAPFLGPGRVAVFFRRGVTVGQAQRLLTASSARPMRLIPRKHGILAQVMPGREAEIGERLREHPYVENVVYMEYDERGAPRNAGR